MLLCPAINSCPDTIQYSLKDRPGTGNIEALKSLSLRTKEFTFIQIYTRLFHHQLFAGSGIHS